jgi:secondary thiamine-phosphate synthase enzyme
MVPEKQNFFTHTDEGADDMPAHIKASVVGQTITIPVTKHKINLGTWQGIYFCEFRNYPSKRKILLTIYN